MLFSCSNVDISRTWHKRTHHDAFHVRGLLRVINTKMLIARTAMAGNCVRLGGTMYDEHFQTNSLVFRSVTGSRDFGVIPTHFYINIYRRIKTFIRFDTGLSPDSFLADLQQIDGRFKRIIIRSYSKNVHNFLLKDGKIVKSKNNEIFFQKINEISYI